MNKWIGCGRITRDLELKVDEKNRKTLWFSIAINEGTKEKPSVYYQDILATDDYKPFASTIERYCAKGDQLIVEGKNASYKAQDGSTRYYVKLTGFDFGQKKERNADFNSVAKETNDGVGNKNDGDEEKNDPFDYFVKTEKRNQSFAEPIQPDDLPFY